MWLLFDCRNILYMMMWSNVLRVMLWYFSIDHTIQCYSDSYVVAFQYKAISGDMLIHDHLNIPLLVFHTVITNMKLNTANTIDSIKHNIIIIQGEPIYYYYYNSKHHKNLGTFVINDSFLQCCGQLVDIKISSLLVRY